MEPLLIPACEIENTIRVVNSDFVASVKPVFTVDEAREYIKEIISRYPDANHHVPAFIIGHGKNTTSHCTDDGEPSGTAGRPALAVLSGSGIGDIVVVVTRFFGGTKLGTGGLVRAYGDAVRQVLLQLPLAEKVATYTMLLNISYPLFERAKQLLEKHHAKIEDEDFAADILLTFQLRVEDYDSLRQDLLELTFGNLQMEIMENNPNTIMPYSSD